MTPHFVHQEKRIRLTPTSFSPMGVTSPPYLGWGARTTRDILGAAQRATAQREHAAEQQQSELPARWVRRRCSSAGVRQLCSPAEAAPWSGGRAPASILLAVRRLHCSAASRRRVSARCELQCGEVVPWQRECAARARRGSPAPLTAAECNTQHPCKEG